MPTPQQIAGKMKDAQRKQHVADRLRLDAQNKIAEAEARKAELSMREARAVQDEARVAAANAKLS